MKGIPKQEGKDGNSVKRKQIAISKKQKEDSK